MKKAELVIIGGGPAGLCAAISAASSGAKVLIIERNKSSGIGKTNTYVFGSENNMLLQEG